MALLLYANVLFCFQCWCLSGGQNNRNVLQYRFGKAHQVFLLTVQAMCRIISLATVEAVVCGFAGASVTASTIRNTAFCCRSIGKVLLCFKATCKIIAQKIYWLSFACMVYVNILCTCIAVQPFAEIIVLLPIKFMYKTWRHFWLYHVASM